MRIGIVTLYGSLDDRDTHRAVALAGAEPVPLWFADADVSSVDAIIIPGGATYGDYLRAGALASREPIIAHVTDAARAGVPVLGIGNGFQILVEAGLLPGAFTPNESGKFLRRDQTVTIEASDTAWTSGFREGEQVVLPLRSGHGRYVIDDPSRVKVVARYAGDNPNGSTDAIAGVANAEGNVVGIMVHPEFAVEPGFGPDTAERMRSGTDGLRFFSGVRARV